MLNRIIAGLILVSIIFATPWAIAGQTPNNVRIDQLKEAIAKLEAVDRNPATPPEVRDINSGFLQKRRQELQTLLQDRAGAFKQYLESVRNSLTAEEVQKVEQSISGLETELAQLKTGGPAALTAAPTSSPISSASNPTTLSSTRPSSVTRGSILLPNNGNPSLTVPTNPAPVTAMPPAPTATTTKDLPTPQDCSAYKASPASFSLYERYVCDFVDSVKDRKTRGQAPIELTQHFFNLSVILVSQKLRSAFLVDAEEARVDKQVGSNSSNSGSTSLVTKGGTPAVLGFAVENGALERDISGTTITFRGNPVGIVDALSNKGFISGFEDDSPATRFLRKTSFGFSFDTNRGQQPGVFTADKQQLSAVTARIEFINKRDPRLPEYRNDWQNFLATNAQPFLATLTQSEDVLIETTVRTPGTAAIQQWKDKALEDWFEETQAELGKAAPGNVEVVMKAQLAKLPVDELSTETITALNNFARDFGVYLQGRQRIIDKASRGPIATFEYTNKREVNAPNTSNFMGIYETSFGGKADFTMNGSLTIFSTRPAIPNAGRVRDFQFATQIDVPFGQVTSAGKYLLSFSGKYQRLAEDTFNPAGIAVPNTKGDMAIGQVKLTVPIKGLGIRFPISVTFANRTELVKEKTIRGNFGFTFDLDTILAKFKPF